MPRTSPLTFLALLLCCTGLVAAGQGVSPKRRFPPVRGANPALSRPPPSHGGVAPAVVFGNDVVNHADYPFASILFDTSGYFRCGGTLIHNQAVLTAAHCPKPGSVMVGAVDLASAGDDGERIGVAKHVKHNRYNSRTMENDVALVKLAKPVTTHKDQYAKLASKALSDGDSVSVCGWGATLAYSPYNYPSKMQQANLQFITRGTCLGLAGYLPSTSCCAGDKNTQCAASDTCGDTCYGDSGGPVVWLDNNNIKRVVGITSFGPDCGTELWGAYTDVWKMKSWICDTLASFGLTDLASSGC